MKEIRDKELRSIQLDILKDVHAFCVSHHIRYSMAYGTLLGAVRHQGYIPWDDDIDVMMPREDYNRFIQTYKNNCFRVVDMSVDAGYILPHAKVEDTRTVMEEFSEGESVYGVYIDVFPLDGIPDDLLERKAFYRRKSLWNELYNLKIVKVRKGRSFVKNMVLAISHILLSFISARSIAQHMSSMATKYQGQKTAYMGIVARADSRIEEAIPSRYFDEYVSLTFEHLNAMGIKAYNEYLTASYGDYMQLPPVELRVSHHIYTAYWK